jgi:hypothetical protein
MELISGHLMLFQVMRAFVKQYKTKKLN